MTQRIVYCDHNATTPIHPAVKKRLIEVLDIFGNPSSIHAAGRQANALVVEARSQVAKLLNASPEEVFFTGGGSESNNTVLKMFVESTQSAPGFKKDRNAIVTSVIEHPSVLEPAHFLQNKGVPITYLAVDETGMVDPVSLAEVITPETALVSVMMANNEIGTIQRIKELAEIAHKHGAYFHTDAVQAVGKIPVDVVELGVDYLSCSGHKIYGPKGVGALYVKKGAPHAPFIHGGHQEHGFRAGTVNAPSIVAMGLAAQLASEGLEQEMARVASLRDKLKEGLLRLIPDVRVNGNPEHTLPNTLNLSFAGAEGEAILLYLDLEGIAVSTGSACATGSLEPSYVLMATGLGAELAHGSVRFSLGHENNEEDVEYLLEKLPGIISRIRDMSTVYQGRREK